MLSSIKTLEKNITLIFKYIILVILTLIFESILANALIESINQLQI